MGIKIKIVKNDVSTVAKLVLIDSENRVLMLKRSNYVEKYANEWDLPGGHLKEGETLEAGLEREVFEECGVDIEFPNFIEKIDNLHFFHAKYNSQPIKLSHEHVDYKFFTKEDLNDKNKFERIALKALDIKDV